MRTSSSQHLTHTFLACAHPALVCPAQLGPRITRFKERTDVLSGKRAYSDLASGDWMRDTGLRPVRDPEKEAVRPMPPPCLNKAGLPERHVSCSLGKWQLHWPGRRRKCLVPCRLSEVNVATRLGTARAVLDELKVAMQRRAGPVCVHMHGACVSGLQVAA